MGWINPQRAGCKKFTVKNGIQQHEKSVYRIDRDSLYSLTGGYPEKWKKI